MNLPPHCNLANPRALAVEVAIGGETKAGGQNSRRSLAVGWTPNVNLRARKTKAPIGSNQKHAIEHAQGRAQQGALGVGLKSRQAKRRGSSTLKVQQGPRIERSLQFDSRGGVGIRRNGQRSLFMAAAIAVVQERSVGIKNGHLWGGCSLTARMTATPSTGARRPGMGTLAIGAAAGTTFGRNRRFRLARIATWRRNAAREGAVRFQSKWGRRHERNCQKTDQRSGEERVTRVMSRSAHGSTQGFRQADRCMILPG